MALTRGADLSIIPCGTQHQVTQLEHAMRAKDREVAKAKEDKEAGKAAERERAKVCSR